MPYDKGTEFSALHPLIQKWVYKQGWSDLRDIQKQSVEPILAADTDLIISASTASGKTEAAFLPACSAAILNKGGFGILYISPLKALINDQYRRLESLGDIMDMKITAWHGDSSQTRKKRARLDPDGILLITPESLESLLIRNAGWLKEAFANLQYIIIDEYHAFIGFDRGNHLQSILHRMESLLERKQQPIPRIALSATLGDMDKVAQFLRPDKSFPCHIIKGSKNDLFLQMQVRGYIDSLSFDLSDENSKTDLIRDLYNLLRGDSHLVFANSRQRTEKIAADLSDLCKQNFVPNEFFPHHGSLSKELRTDLETRLQQEKLPTTAVCTMTLELGIDIGKVKSIAQVTAPHSVASLRQRLGRSGRRGDSSILRMFITENELNVNSSMSDKLRIELLQSIAMLRLLVSEKWFEPPDTTLYHFSTLFHQILAIIAQWGGVRADQLWALLCKSGPFYNVNLEHFKRLLSDMGKKQLIAQLSSGELVLGVNGEKIVDHYSFYAVFNTPEEYRIIAEDKSLGTLPITTMIIPDQHIIFGGRHWKVTEVDIKKKVIYVIPTEGGEAPRFNGSGLTVHEKVRQEMYNVYKEEDYRISIGGQKVDFLNKTARELFYEGLRVFRTLHLSEKFITKNSGDTVIIPWMGDKVVNTLVALLLQAGFDVSSFSGIINVYKTNPEFVSNYFNALLIGPPPTNEELASKVVQKNIDKYDYLLPDKLLNVGYGSRVFDIERTLWWLKTVLM